MKKLFGFLGVALLLSAVVMICIHHGKKDEKNMREIVESMYEVTYDSTVTAKKYPNAVCVLCEDGYFPNYLSGSIVEDQYGNFLVFYGDDSTRESELSKLEMDTKVLLAEEIGKTKVVIDTVVSSSCDENPRPGSHLSYAYEQFNSDEFLENCNKNKVIIGVVDTGVDYSHPYIVDYINVSKSYDFVNGTPEVFDDGSMDVHATAVDSNIIDILTGGNTDLDFEIINYKGLENGYGTAYDIANCIRKAVDAGCNIINCSFGSAYYNSFIAEAVEYAYENNVIVVASAGNESSSDLAYPAKLPTTISVGSIKEDYSHSEFSNLKADFSAAGDAVLSAYPGNQYRNFWGTSMAAPNLAAMCAILYSEGYTDMESVKAQLTDMCTDLGDSGWDDVFGNGIPVYTEDNAEPAPMPEPPTEEPAPMPEPPTEEPSPMPEPPTKEPSPMPEPPKEEPSPVPEPPTEEPTPMPEPPTEKPTPEPKPPVEDPSKEPEKVVLEKITIEGLPNTEFYIGDKFNSENLILKLHYSDGTTKSGIKTGFEIKAPSMNSAGIFEVKVQYKECVTSYNIIIKTPTIQIVSGNVGGDTSVLSVVTVPNMNNVEWNTSDANIVTVSNGIVKVNKKAGTAVVSATVTYNNIQYQATKTITVGYSEWSTLSDYRFAKEATSDLKRESVYTLYFWYYFECSGCGYHSSHWNINCPVCGQKIVFDGVKEVYAPVSFDVGGNVVYGKANLTCEALIRDVSGRFYNSMLVNTAAYIHNSKAVNTAYRYQTRSYIISSIK